MEAKESKDALAAAVPTAATEKPEKPVAAEEVLDALYELSQALNSGISKETLSSSLDVIEQGVDPTTLAYASSRFSGGGGGDVSGPQDLISALVGGGGGKLGGQGTHGTQSTQTTQTTQTTLQMHQDIMDLVAHASLDIIDDIQTKSNSMYHKSVDSFNGWTVSAFITPSIRFVLLHTVTNDDNIRNFFQECWRVFLDTLLNPFYTPTDAIQGKTFGEKLEKFARKYL
ncbi:hypothetical protein E3P94_03170 [Wallemia ichthyophaga]|nr:hypothetical protein E3P94_03170 [Wallemia ichthyophaga]TIA98520.1 hypothetical protein E3P95_02440 [Wallemia ichthyophaga]